MTSVATEQHANQVPRQSARRFAGTRGMLDRPDLLRLLDRATTKRVTVISAPPGSGKTSLLRAWADRSDLRHRVTYTSVDRGQQDTQLFWSALLEAIRGPAPSTGAAAPGAAPGAATLDGHQWVDAVVAALAEVEPAVLIIDDLHELNLPDGRGQLERLVSTLPPSARLILSSRRNPPLRLHQLRLADELAEIRADDLRFSKIEARELLAASGITLSERTTATLHQRAEGWAAGLRMAVMSLRGHPDPERFVAEFSGTDRAVGEYLMAEMFERQPSMIQNLLLRTALVDRLNGELADLLAGRSGSEQVLLHLEDVNAFVVSLNPSRTWFRYHQLFADFLRLELRRRHADEIPGLHRRAAQWLDHHGEIADAVRHLLAAGEWPDAARLLADHLFSLTLDGQEGTIAALLRLFPAGVSVDHPELALAHAAVELAQGRLEEAAARLAQAETHANSAPPDRRPSLAVAVASLRLALARRSGRFTEVLEQVSLLDASTAGTSSDLIKMSSELRAVALMNLGIVETWSGRFADADRHMIEGATLAEAIGRPYLEVTCRAYQAFPSPLSSLATARDRGRQALTAAERHGLTDRPVLAPAMGAIACITVWMGEFEEGERWLRHGWSVVQPDIDPATAVLLHMVTGMVHAGRGEHRSALEALTAAMRAQSLLTGAHILASVIAEWLAVTQARLGMPDEARATIAAFSAEHEPMHGIALARALISLTEGDPAAALAALGDVRDMAPPPGFPAYALVEAHVLAGLAHLALGDHRAAAAAAEEALAAAEPDRLIYPFALFDAAALLDVLPRHQTAHGALLVDVVDLLRETPPSGRDRGQASSSAALSRSELRVLRYLPTNLTRPEIARELGVSINTVNTHIRNVYAKLGARDRSTAVQQARHLRLLSNQLPSTRPT